MRKRKKMQFLCGEKNLSLFIFPQKHVSLIEIGFLSLMREIPPPESGNILLFKCLSFFPSTKSWMCETCMFLWIFFSSGVDHHHSFPSSLLSFSFFFLSSPSLFLSVRLCGDVIGCIRQLQFFLLPPPLLPSSDPYRRFLPLLCYFLLLVGRFSPPFFFSQANLLVFYQDGKKNKQRGNLSKINKENSEQKK